LEIKFPKNFIYAIIDINMVNLSSRRVMDLEKKIALVQRSTRTLFNSLVPIHDWCRLRSRLYYKWSLKPSSHLIHWLILIAYVISLPFIFAGQFNPSNVSKPKAEGVTYDFPRWEWVNPKPGASILYKVTTCSDQSVWAVGDGTVLKSTDFGASWANVYTGTDGLLGDILCMSPNNIIAVGGSGLILQFDGISWTDRFVPTDVTFSSVVSLGDQNLVVAGSEGNIYTSNDNGNTWLAANNKPVALSSHRLRRR
jgi:hypothetical protein